MVGCSGSPSGTSNDTTTQNETATDPEPTAITLDNSFVIVHATSASDEELAAATTIKAALARKGIQATVQNDSATEAPNEILIGN